MRWANKVKNADSCEHVILCSIMGLKAIPKLENRGSDFVKHVPFTNLYFHNLTLPFNSQQKGNTEYVCVRISVINDIIIN